MFFIQGSVLIYMLFFDGVCLSSTDEIFEYDDDHTRHYVPRNPLKKTRSHSMKLLLETYSSYEHCPFNATAHEYCFKLDRPYVVGDQATLTATYFQPMEDGLHEMSIDDFDLSLVRYQKKNVRDILAFLKNYIEKKHKDNIDRIITVSSRAKEKDRTILIELGFTENVEESDETEYTMVYDMRAINNSGKIHTWWHPQKLG